LLNYKNNHYTIQEFMANTSTLSKEDRKKSKRAARKKRATEHPLKPREYARGSQKRKVKKLARGQAKR
jgi:thiamine kinase-like enzyme